jgi:hypothetical protein
MMPHGINGLEKVKTRHTVDVALLSFILSCAQTLSECLLQPLNGVNLPFRDILLRVYKNGSGNGISLVF